MKTLTTLLIIFCSILLVSIVIWRFLKNKREKVILKIKEKEKNKDIDLKKSGFRLRFVDFNTKNFKYNGHIKWYKRFLETFFLGSSIFAIVGIVFTILSIFNII